MTLLENNLYQEDIKRVGALDLSWDKLSGKTVLLSGATGLVGSFLIDVLNYRNKEFGSNTKIIALGRNKQRIYDRFGLSGDTELFKAIVQDVNDDLSEELLSETADFVLHLASNTHPLQYSTDPIGTIITNIIGLRNMLDFAADKKAERFVFASSVEIYGENKGDTERFEEGYLGYIDCNTLRAGYPESKRAGEALCQAYMKQKELDVVIPRLSRTYGPSMLKTDTKAISQFIKKGVDKEDIILKSEGNQLYSYSYVADAVTGLLYCLLYGENGEAYNIADPDSDITLKDMANVIADYVGTKVIFELPDATEAAGYSKATKAMLDSAKLKNLGWKAEYDMKKGLTRTIDVLRTLN
ncbi:Nucleoside-diphosphate-sugar epimerase [Butyrivibrio sp. ob235]|uniref:NAD-dependent epimerase/dehydratase family protein n=1 Tax=Butyrivibrio sp. ob235 TaxID=1761780 RepID=UPI0008D61827|nr:NAD-dependent epimerase/dehydratase family protein [Butyrivibrio sp. ob235]SEL81857.1 Nucleoside-diphosphate-sugar epimerase [Butyrivibrio sp. ob235]